MVAAGAFLGLNYCRDKALSARAVSSWPRAKLMTKFKSLVKEGRDHNHFPPGTASKVFGMFQFLETGMFGRVRRGGLCAVRERQQESGKLFVVTPQLDRMFEFIFGLLAIQPRREIQALPGPRSRFFAASDAAADEPSNPQGGFLLMFYPRTRLAGVSDMDLAILEHLGEGEQKIANLTYYKSYTRSVHIPICSGAVQGSGSLTVLQL
ncbi:unnamed protein product [Polarella glacialis]|uniref:Uncharacterized protein n=1 Tax=Polarella glacialis TaxID=89957 RepID=A0A813JAX1_POLGL|nr:unnamed protein product [Polarella glacialis]CAE8672315.1 unnamed protein product [Polarella glacialis]